MFQIKNNRVKFFFKHLLISFLVLMLVMIVVFFIWYPAPLADAVGVTTIFVMMLVVDVIVGPLLGLIVYKEGKKSLKLDLSIIIVLQIMAFCYGVFSIYQGRPVWLVYSVDRFELIRKNEIVEENIEDALPQFQNISWFSPKYAAIRLSTDSKQKSADIFSEVFDGISIAQKPARYMDYNQVKDQVIEKSNNINELKKYNDIKSVQYILQKYPLANAFIPLQATAKDMTVLINSETGEVIKIVDLRPW